MTKKIALITGASKGIGLALARKMVSENFIVIGTSRSGSIPGVANADFHPLALDLSKPSSLESACTQLLDQFPRIDVLINNAGIGPDLGAKKPDWQSFHSTFEVNVSGTVFFTEKLISAIHDNGIILNVSSKMGAIDLCELTDSVAYRMSKSALNMYTKLLANRLQGNIRVASVHPGWVKTSITKGNLIHGRLTPEQSAERIFEFLISDFDTGAFWNAETESDLPW